MHTDRSEDESRKQQQRVRGRTAKQRGEAIEAEFLAVAAGLGFKVSKPWGDSERYDFLIEGKEIFWRVQVKHTTCRRGDAYFLSLSEPCYTAQEIDFLVVYVAPVKVWYVIPIAVVESHQSLGLRPDLRESKFDRYRDAWCLFTCTLKARGWNNIPVVCRGGRDLSSRCAVCPRRPAPEVDEPDSG